MRCATSELGSEPGKYRAREASNAKGYCCPSALAAVGTVNAPVARRDMRGAVMRAARADNRGLDKSSSSSATGEISSLDVCRKAKAFLGVDGAMNASVVKDDVARSVHSK